MNPLFYTTAIDYIHFSNLLSGLILLYYSYNIHIYNILFPIMFLISYMYHINKEENIFYNYLDYITCKLILIYIYFTNFYKIFTSPYIIFISILTYYFFISSKHRNLQEFRTKNYIIYHSLFHFLICYLIIIIIQ